ncbi:MAG TPA: hypothetical protein VN515_07780 [Terriglobales bacterium]|nr:hypothetical protein [Terriglobales bacterium]
MLSRIVAGLVLGGLITGAAIAQGAAAPPASPHPAISPDESAAIQNIARAFRDPATTATQMDEVINYYRQRYPAGSSLLSVLLVGERYSRAHSNYLRELDYGTQVLQLDPHNLYTLATLGQAIPDNVKQSDLDMDQRLSQAGDYDREVITVVGGLLPTDSGLEFQGIHYTAAQVKLLQQNLEGPAYLSLGRIATLREQYDDAISALRSALPFETNPAGQAQVYYDIGVAARDGQHRPEAEEAFTKAAQLAPKDSLLQRMALSEQSKLKNP